MSATSDLTPLPRDRSALIRLQSFLAAALLVVLFASAYRWAPFDFHRRQFGELYGMGSVRFTAGEYLAGAVIVYLLALAWYYARMAPPVEGKALKALRVFVGRLIGPPADRRAPLAEAERVALLACLLKGFFAPMMVVSLMIFCTSAAENAAALWVDLADGGSWSLLQGRAFFMMLHAILFIDVLVFTFGYLVELPGLHNEIRSVDSSWLGWAAALVCYPPFNTVTLYIYGYVAVDFPQFEDATAHVVLNVVLLVMMGVYTWASVAMGWKGSNLTHRGIVEHGPYRFVRHPAYICKNTAWWIGAIPAFSAAFAISWWTGLVAVLSMASWSAIYVLRALTEEDHLRRVDSGYAAYAARVRWRFIPGVI